MSEVLAQADLFITAAVLVAAVALFVTDAIPAGQTAMLAAAALLVGGVLSGEQVLAGFANPATVTVGGMFVVSAAIHRTGALTVVGDTLGRLLRSRRLLALGALCVGGGVLSAFVNNTTVVAILLPVVVRSSMDAEVSPSRLLMPLSFAAMLGGTCTLIGTSTNLIVETLAVDEGLAPIGLFELAPVGLPMFGIALLYLLGPGRWLVPERREVEPARDLEARTEYVTEVRIETPDGGERVDTPGPLDGFDLDVLEIVRDGEPLGGLPGGATRIRDGDLVRVRCAARQLPVLLRQPGVKAATSEELRALDEGDVTRVEALVHPRSSLVGKPVDARALRQRLGAVVLGIRRAGVLRTEGLAEERFRAGDLLLLAVSPERVDDLGREGQLVVASVPSEPRYRRKRMPLAIGILLGLVGTAAVGWLSIAEAATIGAIVALISGCVRLDEAVEAVDWNVMLLLAGVISLGTAMETSGAAAHLADVFALLAGGAGIHVAVLVLYVGTALITSVLSNGATAALLTPIAVGIAGPLEVDPRPLVMAIAFGASTALLTPVGYQTNTMVYGAGRYRFSDYARVGGPLMLLLAPAAAFLIPWVWPP